MSRFSRVMRCPKCRERSALVPSNTQKHRITFEAGYNNSAGRSFSTKRERDNWLRETGRVLL